MRLPSTFRSLNREPVGKACSSERGSFERLRKSQDPALLDLGGGPKLGERVIALDGVTRIRVERKSGPGVWVSGDYGRWDWTRDLQGLNLRGFVGQIPTGVKARSVFKECLEHCAPKCP